MAAVSVIIPALNAERTLPATLESLRKQSFADWEAVVIDNGSADSTAAVAARFAANDGRYRIVREPTRGISAARNRGIAESRAPLLLFLDADDTILRDHLRNMVAALDGHDGAIAYTGFRRMTSEGRLLPPVFDADIERQPFATFARRNRVQPNCLLVPRQLVIELGGFDTSLETCEDWDLWQRLARTGARFIAVNEISAIYHMRTDSVSRDLRKLARDGLEVLARCRKADPRVPRPAPETANGIPAPHATAPGYFILWLAVVSAAATGQVPDELLRVPQADFAGEAPVLIATIVSALETGAEAGPDRLAHVWANIRHLIVPLIEQLEAGSTEEGLAHAIVIGLERDLARCDPLQRSLLATHGADELSANAVLQ